MVIHDPNIPVKTSFWLYVYKNPDLQGISGSKLAIGLVSISPLPKMVMKLSVMLIDEWIYMEIKTKVGRKFDWMPTSQIQWCRLGDAKESWENLKN